MEKKRFITPRVQIKTELDNLVHFDTEKNTYTLCGLETMGDSGLGFSEMIPTKRKVNCHHCIEIIRFCKNIRSTEYIRNK